MVENFATGVVSGVFVMLNSNSKFPPGSKVVQGREMQSLNDTKLERRDGILVWRKFFPSHR